MDLFESNTPDNRQVGYTFCHETKQGMHRIVEAKFDKYSYGLLEFVVNSTNDFQQTGERSIKGLNGKLKGHTLKFGVGGVIISKGGKEVAALDTNSQSVRIMCKDGPDYFEDGPYLGYFITTNFHKYGVKGS
jgi:hypothetical protein